MLQTLILLSILSVLHVFLLPSSEENKLKLYSLSYSGLIFLFSLLLWIGFDYSSIGFQYSFTIDWNALFTYKFSFGVDGISLFFIILSTFLIPLCLLASWQSVKKLTKQYVLAFLILDLLLILVFATLDVFLFYIFFETVLIPMFLVIGIWGSRERKIRAAYMFFFYTLVGSLLMLLGIIYLISKTGSTNYEVLLAYKLSMEEQRWLWLAFFASLASKIPMFPFHVWLPEAHVEAPTAGSVLLAGILLKLGSYGFLRYSLALFPDASLYFAPLVYALAVIGVIFTSLTAIRQTDFKRIIAYSSVAHMNLVMLGLFSFQVNGLEGAVLQSLSHGLASSALFLLIGVIYDRHHSRLIYYYSGLVQVMPLYIILFLFFTMANIALPGTSSFIGEFLILAGIYKFNTTICFLGATAMVLGGAYSLWLYNRVAYGNIKIEYIKQFEDINYREFIVLLPLVLGVLFIGIYPNLFLEPIHASVTSTFLFFLA
jgi:NADH-quinone oxidoreductase subunit M